MNALAEGNMNKEITVDVDVNHREPWIEGNMNKEIPLHIAIREGHKEVALSLLSIDSNISGLMSGFCDKDGYTPLYLAVEKGFEDVALRMLESSTDSSDKDNTTSNYQNPLSVVPQCSENVGRKLLERYPDLMYRSNNVSREETFLHDWVRYEKLDSLKWFLEQKPIPEIAWSTVRQKVICQKDTFDYNPLHVAAERSLPEVADLLIEAYLQEQKYHKRDQYNGKNQHPWLQRNKNGDTPLLLAIRNKKFEVGMHLLDEKNNPEDQCKITSNTGESPLFLAVQNNYFDLVREIILKCTSTEYTVHTGPDKQNPMHVALNCPEIAKLLIEYHPEWAKSKDSKGNTPLDNAAKAGDTSLIELLLMKVNWMENSPRAWVNACENGHVGAFHQLISSDKEKFWRLCEMQTDTPLHHICLTNQKDYEEFIKTYPGIEQQINVKDSQGATPLHQAIQRKDLVLAEVLLKIKAKPDIKDNNGVTAMAMLASECEKSKEWDSMCKRTDIYPRIKTSYVSQKTNLGEMRGTMSVVAALLATITFAAGLQVPGGFNDKGKDALGNNAAFVAFLIFDTYAMCCSMVVLFSLIWAMDLDNEKALVLIDLSVSILQQSFYGTLLAFMTGVYAVVSHHHHSSGWAVSIFIIVVCCMVLLITNKSILLWILQSSKLGCDE
ncbi:ankyrin-1-like [Chenopodium quinoa]|uniref:ankyrin-1-like n=1 Tax=Chenopodium quinoa TaxID=63459 RepID=UPI000B796859|nr:ankyrin-1-like [Chenopodium quinoa]